MPIMGVPVSANGKVFHPEHFVCYKCNTPMHRSKYYPFENRVYCEHDFKEVTGKVCQYCLRVSKGKSINSLGNEYCENHFMYTMLIRCMGCFTSLADVNKAKFIDFDSKPFCTVCYDKLPAKSKKKIEEYKIKEAKYGTQKPKAIK